MNTGRATCAECAWRAHRAQCARRSRRAVACTLRAHPQAALSAGDPSGALPPDGSEEEEDGSDDDLFISDEEARHGRGGDLISRCLRLAPSVSCGRRLAVLGALASPARPPRPLSTRWEVRDGLRRGRGRLGLRWVASTACASEPGGATRGYDNRGVACPGPGQANLALQPELTTSLRNFPPPQTPCAAPGHGWQIRTPCSALLRCHRISSRAAPGAALWRPVDFDAIKAV